MKTLRKTNHLPHSRYCYREWEEVDPSFSITPENADLPTNNLEELTQELLNHTNTLGIEQNLNPPKSIVAVTPTYFEDGALNISAYRRDIKSAWDHGQRGFLSMGTTHENALVVVAEHEVMNQIMTEEVQRLSSENDKGFVLAGACANATFEEIHLAEHAKAIGADATLLYSNYNIGSQDDANLLIHLWKALDIMPGIIYRITERQGNKGHISNEVITQLAKHPNYLGVKECDEEHGGGIEKSQESFEIAKPSNAYIYTGEDGSAYNDIHEKGAYGVVSVTANSAPELIGDMTESQQTKINQKRIIELANATFAPSNPRGIRIIRAMENVAQGTREVIGSRHPVSLDTKYWQQYMMNQPIFKELGIQLQPYGNNVTNHTTFPNGIPPQPRDEDGNIYQSSITYI